MSDSHDNTPLVRVVAQLFRDEGVERVLHLGDVCIPDTLGPLLGFDLTVVAGNNDDPAQLAAHAERHGYRFEPTAWRDRIAGVPVGATHGHLRGVKARLAEHLDHGLLLHGHTHRACDDAEEGLRVVNPGALYRARERSACVLDLSTGAARFHAITEHGARRLEGLPGRG